MFTRLNIKGFKSLADVSVELGMVNVFIGANGSGKSNLLESAGFLNSATCAHKNGVTDSRKIVDAQALLRRGVRPGPLERYVASFRGMDPLETLEIEAVMASGQKAMLEIPLNNEREPHLSYLDFDFAIFSPHTPVLRGVAPDMAQRIPVGLSGGRLAEAVDDLLNDKNEMFGDLHMDDLFELIDWVDRIDVAPPSRDLVDGSVPTLRNIICFTDHWMGKQRNRFSAYDASEGALYVLFALTLAMHPDTPGLFAIDNFDQSMHPRLARALTRIFCERILQSKPAKQALLTTHNPLVLDGLDLMDDRIRLFAVERNSFGATEVHRIAVTEGILRETQSGLSLSNLWILGRLGGAPDI